MDELIFTLILFLIPILCVVIPVGASYVIYDIIKKKNTGKYLQFFALTPILIVGYLIYSSMHPDNDFYRTDFKTVTSIELPDSAGIIEKTTTFPDHFFWRLHLDSAF